MKMKPILCDETEEEIPGVGFAAVTEPLLALGVRRQASEAGEGSEERSAEERQSHLSRQASSGCGSTSSNHCSARAPDCFAVGW